MVNLICHDIMSHYHDRIENFRCEGCGPTPLDPYNFHNSDEVLKKAVPMVMENRKEYGLEGLVGDLRAVIINTQEENLIPATQELLDFTGMKLHSAFEGLQYRSLILKLDDSADIIVKHRKKAPSPFRDHNVAPKTAHYPDTRLETFVFETPNIEKYVDIQKSRGVQFLSEEIINTDNYSFIQTIPSCFTGNSIGLIQWRGEKGRYTSENDKKLETGLQKKDTDYLCNIKYMDHAATRLECLNRDAGIVEFMELTNYKFEFAIYVKSFNSITNVARLSKGRYAQVFTTGIEPFKTLETSGPTEKYVHNYGPRVHHMAFHTENIEDTFEGLKNDGMRFLIHLIGSPDEGLKQTFTKGSPYTFLVNEYIHRYGDFDGFFTKSNVTDLTWATDAQ